MLSILGFTNQELVLVAAGLAVVASGVFALYWYREATDRRTAADGSGETVETADEPVSDADETAVGDDEPDESDEFDEWLDTDDRERGEAWADDMEGAERAGYLAGYDLGAKIVDPLRFSLSATFSFLGGVAMSLTRLMPKSEGIYDSMIKSGYKGIQKTSGADAIGLIRRENGELDHKPVKWKRSAPDDPTQPNRWVTKGGETWHPGTEGRETDWVGPAKVILLDEDAEARGSYLQSRFQAALDLGRKDALFIPETVQQVNFEVNAEALQEGGPEAIADGGAIESQTTYEILDSEWPDKLADVLVDLSAPNGENGMRVSAQAYKEVYQEKVGSEEMQMQELRGRAAEADPQAAKDLMFRIFKWVAIIVAATHLPEVIQMLFGGGGGDVLSDINPLALLPYLPGVLF